jgi:hypothetical protein
MSYPRSFLNIADVHLAINVEDTPVSTINLSVRSPSEEAPIASHCQRGP